MMTERTAFPQGHSAISRGVIRDLIEEEIQRSRKILDLEEDWDGDGACAYAKETWQKAVFFLRNLIDGLPEYALDIEASEELIPEILPGPNGSIDLEWEADRFDLLINIPKDGELASYYGDDYGENQIKGNLNISAPNPAFFFFLLFCGYELAK